MMTGSSAAEAATKAQQLGQALFDAEKKGGPAVDAVASQIQGILDNADAAKESIDGMADAIAAAVGKNVDAVNRFAASFRFEDEDGNVSFGALTKGSEAAELLSIQFSNMAGEMIASGASISEVLERFAPTLEAANQAGVALGGQFAFLQGLSQKLAGNEGLQGVVDRQMALNDMLTQTNDLGFMTQSTFDTFAKNAVKGFDELAKELGSGNMALRVQGPLLGNLRDMAEQYGFKLDDATQGLIDQGEKLGALPAPMETAESIMSDMRDILLSIADVFGADLPDSVRRFRDRVKDDMSDAAKEVETQTKEAAKRVADTLNNTEFRIPVEFDAGKINYGGGKLDLPEFAGGSNGFQNFGRGTLAVLHGRERVQTEAQARMEMRASLDDQRLVSEIRALRNDMRRAEDVRDIQLRAQFAKAQA